MMRPATKMHDLVIAGGGPAGLAAAIQAARAGLGVLVVEPHQGVIDKACGEGIMPGGVLALRSLGIHSLVSAPFNGVRYGDATDSNLSATGNFRPGSSGLGVRRTVLHEALLEAALESGVQFHRGRITAFEQREDHIYVLNEELRTKWLIGADGLRSKVREALGVCRPSHFRPRLGLRRHYRVSPWSDHVEVYFAPGVEAYVTPVDKSLVGVAFLFAAEPKSHDNEHRYDALLSKFPLLAARLPKEHATTLRGAGPFEQRVSRRVLGNVLLIGDAAGYLDPLTGEGVALGLATAEAAIANIVQGTALSYEADYRQLARRYFALTSLLLRIAHHPVLHKPLIRLARATPSVFDRILDSIAHLDRPKRLAHALTDQQRCDQSRSALMSSR